MKAEATPLAAELKRLIVADGPIRLDRFMEQCLGHPRYGYYTTRDPFGSQGDFTTAPEVSQMFGELIAVWCAEAWDAMGRPEDLRLVELGPGRGTLMADVARTLRSIPSFTASCKLDLVEISPVLKAAQQRTLAMYELPVAWYDRIADLPPGRTVAIANEFFDALPVRQFEARGGAWHERAIGVDAEGALALGLAPGTVDVSAFGVPDSLDAGDRDGLIWEYAPARDAAAGALAQRLVGDGGVGLIIDYGHLEPGFGDTVQAVRGHRSVGVTETPGGADLTSHVDFSALARALIASDCTVWPALTQGEFLGAMGIGARTQALKLNADEADARDIDAAASRLTDCDQMGNLFKVCAAAGPGIRPPYPFGVTRT